MKLHVCVVAEGNRMIHVTSFCIHTDVLRQDVSGLVIGDDFRTIDGNTRYREVKAMLWEEEEEKRSKDTSYAQKKVRQHTGSPGFAMAFCLLNKPREAVRLKSDCDKNYYQVLKLKSIGSSN